jgi:hypothetical protein
MYNSPKQSHQQKVHTYAHNPTMATTFETMTVSKLDNGLMAA